VAQRGRALEFASEELRADQGVVHATDALRSTSHELQAYHEAVLAAVAQSGRALEFASEYLRSDRKVFWRLSASTPTMHLSISPDAAKQLIKDAFQVVVETGAGQYSEMSDAAYTEVGCTIGSRGQVVAKGNMLFYITPPVADLGRLRDKCRVSWVGRLTQIAQRLSPRRPWLASCSST